MLVNIIGSNHMFKESIITLGNKRIEQCNIVSCSNIVWS